MSFVSTGNKLKVCAAALMMAAWAWADGAFGPVATVAFVDTRVIAAHVQALGKGTADMNLNKTIPQTIMNSPVARLFGPMRPGSTAVAVCYVDGQVVARLLASPVTPTQRRKRTADLERVKHWTLYYPTAMSQAQFLKSRPGVKVVNGCLAIPPAQGQHGPIVYALYSPDGKYVAVSVSPILTKHTGTAAAAALKRPLGNNLAFIDMSATGARVLFQTDACAGGKIAIRMGAAGLEFDGTVKMPPLTHGVLPKTSFNFAGVPANAPLFGAATYGQDIRGAEVFAIAGPEFAQFVRKSLALTQARGSSLTSYHLPAWKRPGRPAPKVVAQPRLRFAAILPEAAKRNNLENVMFCSPTEVLRQGLPRVAATLPITEATKYEIGVTFLKPVRGDGMGFMSWREGPNEHFFMRISRDELRGTAGIWSALFL